MTAAWTNRTEDGWSVRDTIRYALEPNLWTVLRKAVPALAAWVQSKALTDTYWAKGEDTLTYGDPGRWIQVKGFLASVPSAATPATEDIKVDPATRLEGYERVLQALSEVNADTAARQKQKNAAAIRLLDAWLADESGYDERVWPQVKNAIEQHPLSERKRFYE